MSKLFPFGSVATSGMAMGAEIEQNIALHWDWIHTANLSWHESFSYGSKNDDVLVGELGVSV